MATLVAITLTATLVVLLGVATLLPSTTDAAKPLFEMMVFIAFFYLLLRFMQGTRGEGILKGMAAVLIVGFMLLFYVAQELELPRLRPVLQSFLQYAVIALVIIFQPELRRGLMRIGENPFVRFFIRDSVSIVDEVVEAAVRLATKRIGALIAIEREGGLGTYIEGGVALDAEIHAELLETLFFPGTPLHDGAVIIREQRVAAAGCLFPLTDNPSISKQLGTRHRAAIGITEESDAISIVCSEETGQISVGVDGQLHRNLNKESLADLLRRLISANTTQDPNRPGRADAGEPRG